MEFDSHLEPKSCNGNPTAGLKGVIEITREFSVTQSEIYYDIEVEDIEIMMHLTKQKRWQKQQKEI